MPPCFEKGVAMRICKYLLSFALVCAGSVHGQITGAGATFPSSAYQTWGVEYQKRTAKQFVYTPTGSGDGLKKIIARAVDVGASDIALPPAELARHGLIQLPMLVGAMVPVVNLKGVSANALRLNGAVLADIFMGKVVHWQDPSIKALNPGLRLPNLPIVRVVRADKSGSTETFTQYLSMHSEAFEKTLGRSGLPAWPAAGSPLKKGEGNDGVVKLLKELPGAISYASYDRVLKQELTSVALRNGKDSGYVSVSERAFRAAVLASGMYKTGDESRNLLNIPHEDAWPITMTTFVLLEAEPKTAAAVQDAVQFIYWTQLSGDLLLKNSGFAPLPSMVQARFAARLASIQPKDGSFISLRTSAGAY
jgi:phosphate transport system substrate-binding protein